MPSVSTESPGPASTVTPTSSSLKNRTIAPTTTPVPLLPNNLARTYTHVHPVVVLSLYRLRFWSLVTDPVPELLFQLLPLAALQIGYVVACLPPTNSSNSARIEDAVKGVKGEGKGKGPKRDTKSRSTASIGGRITTSLLSLPLSLLPGTLILFVLLVLFGAPLTTHHAHTILLGAHMSLLAIFPLCYTHGVNRQSWWEIVAFMLPGDDVWGGALGTVVGAWLGAIPIPLDWDREWQKWPVTILTGAYIGWAVGKYLGSTLLRGKRVSFDP